MTPTAANEPVALVLGAGGARGLAQIGVIEELERRGFAIAAVAGSSIGALIGGLYCADCDIASVSDDGAETSVRAYAVDPGEAARLWALSAELTGVDAFRRA